MEENPFEPPANTSPNYAAQLDTDRIQVAGQPAVWVCVFFIAALAGISSWIGSVPPNNFSGGLFYSAAGVIFWLGPPFAILLIVASREMKLRKMSHGRAFYNAAGFCLSCFFYLGVGYGTFVTTCTGSTLGLMACFNSLDLRFANGIAVSVATFFMTILACLAMQSLHKWIR